MLQTNRHYICYVKVRPFGNRLSPEMNIIRLPADILVFYHRQTATGVSEISLAGKSVDLPASGARPSGRGSMLK